MAVDLTPRFRRLNSQTRCFDEKKLPAGPFRATQLWRNIIEVLQTQVEVRRHRQHLRVHKDCFTGSDAVDVVLSHLMQNIYFCTSDVTRLKAVRLCQALMDARVFEPVGVKLFHRDKELVFEDSGCSLYHFLDSDGVPGSAKHSGDMENETPVKEVGKKRKKSSRSDDLKTISNPLALGSSDRRVERILKTINLQPSMPSGLNRVGLSTTYLSKQVVQEVWKQQTLLQLLQLVEVPMLDCILTSPSKPAPLRMRLLRNHDLVISNTCVDREVSQVLNLLELDSWLMAAADCLELFPDEVIVATGEQLLQVHSVEGDERLGAYKKVLFDAIAKYYNSQERVPLLAGRYMDIHAGILKLQDSGRADDALKAFQLCLRLLDASSRDELRRLLTFLAEAADPKAFQLHKTMENRALISRTFMKAVLQSKDVSRAECEQLLLFLMDHHLLLFKTPVSLIETVTKALQTLQQGRDPDNVALFTFCQQMSTQQFEEQREKNTFESLKELIEHITLTGKMDKRKDFSTFDKDQIVMARRLDQSISKTAALVGCSWSAVEVAVFVFDKKIIDRYQKFEKDQIIDSLKRGVQQLTRLRHPRLLTVQHPLEESRDSLAFCTEPVFASLANVLGQWDNLPSPVPTDIKDHKLFDVEIKYGLLQISEGLSFLHSGVKMVHGNLCPENIILNKSGAWKIMGFDFSISSSNPSDAEPKYVCKEWDPNLPPLCLPNPEYVAPEYILSVSCDSASDMYSLGVVIHAVFNEGKPVFQVNKQDIFKSFSRQLDQLSRLSPGVLSKVPEEVREHVKMLLSVTANVRPDADQMTKIPFFDDVGAVTLQYFDSLFQRDNLQKSQFYKGLPKILPKLPKARNSDHHCCFSILQRVIVYRILPALTSEFVNPDMVPFVLPNVLLIAEECTKEEYMRLILPDLTPVFKQEEPIQILQGVCKLMTSTILLIFLQKMDLLLTKTPPEAIKNNVLPMVYRALEAPSIQIQELCLNIIPTFANLIDYPSMKNALIPRIRAACLQTSSLAVRVNSLVCLGKILEYLDKWFVIDEILPFLQQIPSREPAVLMGILGIYKCTFTHKKLGIPKEHLAGKSLPHLVSLSIDNNLNLNQFNSFMAVIREMLSRMEAEHKTKLEQIHSMQEQQRSLNLNQLNPSEETKSNPSPPSQVRDIDDIFGGSSGSTGVNGKENGSSAAPSQPSRVSLTLEEKQRLAKEQEQAAKLRNLQPLAPQNIKPPTTATNTQAKDLTSSLLNNMNSLNSLSLSSGSRTAPMQTGALSSGFPSTPTMAGMGTMAPISNGFNSPIGFQTGGMGMQPTAPGVYGGMASTNNTPNFSALSQNQNQNQSSKPPDMSALDSLFSANKPKVSLNQMAPKPATGTTPSPWTNQFGAGQPSQTAPMQAVPMGMTGVQGGFGMQANPFFSPQNFSQSAAGPTMNTGMLKQSMSVNNDLKDLFG
ncbi:hypothetical protein QTP70_021010 [Hemibagrus guttatus]|uniref:Protein kinase domain-containing protein n=1 Tax=Hemibagrus guttatus TaxID=175788 RepID=A0AAE0QCG3_9TELE|nr:hypothetical protein QTP70_021010 [Hemibagrus guttatus]